MHRVTLALRNIQRPDEPLISVAYEGERDVFYRASPAGIYRGRGMPISAHIMEWEDAGMEVESRRVEAIRKESP